MDREAPAALDKAYYDGRRESLGGASYSYAQDAYNIQGLQAWEAASVEEHFVPGTRVVVTAAGAGREVYGLLERGYDPIGFEAHPALLAAGADLLRRQGHAGRLKPVARDVFPDAVEACDGVIVGWGSYTAIPARERRIDFLRGARAALPDGGPLLLSFFVRRGQMGYFRLVAAVGGAIRRLRRLEPVERGDALDPHFGHHFTREEMEAELAAGGFRLVSYAPEPYGHAVARAD